jgi:hypothetical protein
MLDDEPKATLPIFRQLGGQRDDGESESRWDLR